MASTHVSTTMLQKEPSQYQGHLVADHLTESYASATIDLQALRHNLAEAKRRCPQQKIMAMVKSRAYGHGLVSCARALSAADGFGVACLGEAVALREAGITQPIFLVSGFHAAEDIAALVQYQLTAIIHSPWQIDVLEQADLSQPLSIWMKVDSGMGRLGFGVESFLSEYQRLAAIPAVEDSIGVITHLSSADDLSSPITMQQILAFKQLTAELSGPKSMANSAGILHWPAAVEGSDWVRPGIMLYGAPPSVEEEAESFGLQPVMTVRAHIIAHKMMKQGSSVGYSATWTCPEDMPVAVLAYGYGDGLPRTAAGLSVQHTTGVAQVIGRVSMDLTTVDCRDLGEVSPGDTVVLWGKGGQSITAAARQMGEFHYELLTRVSSRVRRIYINQ